MTTLAPVTQQVGLPVGVLCQISSVPVEVKCPFCHAQTTTVTEKRAGMAAYCICCGFVSMGGCCLVPCVWEVVKDTVHYCSYCKKELGRHNRHMRR